MALPSLRPRASRVRDLGPASPWAKLCSRRPRSLLDDALPPRGASWVCPRDAGVLLLLVSACSAHRLQVEDPRSMGGRSSSAMPMLVELDPSRTLELEHVAPVAGDLPGMGSVSALPPARWPVMWVWPLTTPPAPPTSTYGPRWGRDHEGVDLAADHGDLVVAAASGRVVQAGPRGTLGLAVELDHGNGWTTRYGHLSAVLVVRGEQVDQGQQLGHAGATGRATGPHLHFEVRRHGKAVDPCRGLRTDQGLQACRPAQSCDDGVCVVGGMR